MLERRKKLDNKATLDQSIQKQVLEISKEYEVISIFHAMHDEIDTLPIIEALLKANKTVACPIVIDGIMRFAKINSLRDFKKGYFGIMEPTTGVYIEPAVFDFILVPLLAFNKSLYRVGYGGGYYDGFLKDTQAFKLGLAYTFQEVECEFQKDYDIALDAVLTEKGVY